MANYYHGNTVFQEHPVLGVNLGLTENYNVHNRNRSGINSLLFIVLKSMYSFAKRLALIIMIIISKTAD